MFGVLDISVSALVAQRTRMEVYSANAANANSITDANGNYAPYRRRIPVFAVGDPTTGNPNGVHVARIDMDRAPLRMVYQPDSKFADANGMVGYPNVDSTLEQTSMLEAARAYEANITMAEATKAMIQSSLRLLA